MKETILLSRSQVAALLSDDECIDAVKEAFRLFANRRAKTPGILGIHSDGGGFHIKAGILGPFFAAKVNANFPANPKRHGLPTIQGMIIVCDAYSGRLLAVMDSIEITIKRTGAATALAVKFLSKKDSKTMTICGCGNQGRVSLSMAMKMRNLETVYAYDKDQSAAEIFALDFSSHANIQVVKKLEHAVSKSDIVVTCTPSRNAFIKKEWIVPGTFIAAVGADHEEKQELDPMLVCSSKLITDVTAQCAAIGELHHAIESGGMDCETVYAELGEITAEIKPGRVSDDEIIIFDSTGMALQDVAAAVSVFNRSIQKNSGLSINLSD